MLGKLVCSILGHRYSLPFDKFLFTHVLFYYPEDNVPIWLMERGSRGLVCQSKQKSKRGSQEIISCQLYQSLRKIFSNYFFSYFRSLL